MILTTGFGYDPNHSIVRAGQEGLCGVIFKPFKVEQLIAEVRKAVGGPGEPDVDDKRDSQDQDDQASKTSQPEPEDVSG